MSRQTRAHGRIAGSVLTLAFYATVCPELTGCTLCLALLAKSLIIDLHPPGCAVTVWSVSILANAFCAVATIVNATGALKVALLAVKMSVNRKESLRAVAIWYGGLIPI